MSGFWLKRTADGQPEGPYTSAQLKAAAAAGHITAAAFLSADGSKWTSADKVKGLFAAPESSAAPTPPVLGSPEAAPQGYPPGDVYDVREEAPPPLPPYPTPASYRPNPSPAVAPTPLGYASGYGHGYGYGGIPGRTRNVSWYLIVSGIFFALGLFAQGISIVQGQETPGNSTGTPEMSPGIAGLFLGSMCFAMLGLLAMWIYWLVWLGTVHGEMRNFTGGQYPISPGKAIGFCFIPFYNLYWIVYMPQRLAKELESLVGPESVNPSHVVLFQVLGLIPGLFIWGMGTFMQGFTMRNIQNGLNELWNRANASAYQQHAAYQGGYAPAY